MCCPLAKWDFKIVLNIPENQNQNCVSQILCTHKTTSTNSERNFRRILRLCQIEWRLWSIWNKLQTNFQKHHPDRIVFDRSKTLLRNPNNDLQRLRHPQHAVCTAKKSVDNMTPTARDVSLCHCLRSARLEFKNSFPQTVRAYTPANIPCTPSE